MKASRSFSLGFVAVIFFALCPVSSWAQAVATGTITGTVTDNTAAVVVGASVTLLDRATGDTRGTTTNDTGHYIFQNVAPGKYLLKFKKDGFSETDVTDATVDVGTQLNENVQMKLGAITTTVTVTETAGAELQTMNSTVGQTVSGIALDSLPSIGHDVVTFATLQPGVTPSGSVAGTVMDQSSFTLDGGNNTNDMDGGGQSYTPSFGGDPTGGVIAGTGLRGGNTTGGVPSGVMPTPSDSVEEVKVNSANQTADFNSSSGSQVELVTRRGTNNWHGSLYEYYLDNNFDANTWDNTLTSTSRPDYHYSFFGARAGGPIVPKEILGGKTYLFANYQGFRWPNSTTFEQAVPSANMRQGILTFGGVNYNVLNYDPRGIGINPVVQQLWTTYEPMPNDPGCGSLAGSRCDGVNEQGFKSNIMVPIDDNFGAVRLDHDFGSKWRFNSTYRYYHLTHATTSQVDVGGFFAGDKLGVPASLSSKPLVPWFYTAGMTTNITPSLTNDFHYSYTRNFWSWSDAGAPSQFPSSTSGVLEPLGEVSTTVLAPYNVNTQSIRTRFWDGKDNYFRDDLTLLHGNHLFQFGGLFERNWNYHQRTDNGGGINYTLTYQLGDTAGAGKVDLSSVYALGYAGGTPSVKASRDFAAVTGMITDAQIAYTRAGSNLALNAPLTPAYDISTIPYYNIYFSDSWHLKPSITLTYGLSWTLEMPPVEATGKQVELVDSSGQQLDVEAYLHQREASALQGQVYNPTVGFALVGNTGAGQKYPYHPFYGSFSPRVAVAWNPHFDSGTFASKIFGENSTVVRGGYGRIYGRLDGVDLVLVPLLGTGLIQPVQCRQELNALAPGGTACGPTNPTATTVFRAEIDGPTAPLAAASPTLPQPVFPGINNVAASAGEALDPNFRPNVVDSFDLTIQRQFGPKWMAEIGYIGRRITHEYQPININAVPYMMTMGGQNFAQAYAAVETAMGCATSIVACNNATSATTAVASQPFFEAALAGTGYCAPGTCTATVVANEFSNFQSQSVWSLWSDLDQGGINGGPGGATVPGFNFPRSMLNTAIYSSPNGLGLSGQMTSGVGVNASVGYGNYNGVFATLKSNDWHGVTTQQNFTFSRALGTGAEVQATSEFTLDDPYNQSLMYGPQFFNQKFIYNLFVVYQPPVFKGQQGALGHILGGWNFSPIFTAGSGTPLFCNTNTDAQAFGSGDGANFFDNEQCVFTKPYTGGDSLHYNVMGSNGIGTGVATDANGNTHPGSSVNIFANPEAVWDTVRAPILGIDKRDNGSGILPGIPYWNVDLSVKKNIKFNERLNAEFQFLFLNVFNHNVLAGSDPMDLTAPAAFGVYNFQSSSPRQFEFGLRFNF